MHLKLFILFLIVLPGSARAQNSDVHINLSLSDAKTVYRIGEEIKLVMTFTADRDGYVADTLSDSKAPTFDTIVTSPGTGVSRWVDELNDNASFLRCVISQQNLTSSPTRIEFILNDTLRFDNPGRYTISVTTRRVKERSRRDSPLVLSTNSVTIEIQEMSEVDEAKEVKRLSDLLEARRNLQSNGGVSQQLSYLTGDPSTREKARRFLNPEHSNNSYHDISYGVFIARNRALMLKLLESGLRDPSIPVTTQLLFAVTRLKMLQTNGVSEKRAVLADPMFEPAEDARASEIRDSYVVELAAGLSKRTGLSQTTTAQTILMSLPKEPESSGVALREARRILVQEFDTLQQGDKDILLRVYWDRLRDPSLIPFLKKMLATSDRWSKPYHEVALNRLIEMAPDESRSYVVAEIYDIASMVDVDVLGRVEAKSIPEVDIPLLEQIRHLSKLPVQLEGIYLERKVKVLVRFATDSIYPQLMELFQTAGENLPPRTRAAFLAYFAKHNEREAVPMIEQALSTLKPFDGTQLLTDLTKSYYSDSIGLLIKRILETDDAAAASDAAYLIGEHGLPGDEKVLEERLKRWYEQWRDRMTEADIQLQGMIERELVYALIHGKSWKLSPERIRELQAGCVTKMCKESNQREPAQSAP